MKKIAIVGGGCSGVLVAVALLRQTEIPCRIDLYEPASTLGRGIAYGTTKDYHLLNVPAARMGALADKIDDFLVWMHERGIDGSGSDFMPRTLYAKYLSERLSAFQTRASGFSEFRHVQHAVVEVSRTPQMPCSTWRVKIDSGAYSEYDKVVLALGLPEGGWPKAISGLEAAAEKGSPRLIEDVWRDPIPPYPDESVIAVLGSGLTAIDVALAVFAESPNAKVALISRHGELPRPHFSEAADPVPLEKAIFLGSLRHSVEVFRSLLKEYRWDSVIDSIRPSIPTLWSNYSDAERSSFSRHLRHTWDVHRHRMAPSLWKKVCSLQQSGHLSLVAGRCTGVSVTSDGVTVDIDTRGRNASVRIEAAALYNCTGFRAFAEEDYNGLLSQLERDQYLKLDRTRTGVEPQPRLSLTLQPGLLILGPLLRGVRWESIAVPELRIQAQEIARAIINQE